MANVEQTQKMVPLITCEIPLCQCVCEMVFGVNIFDLNRGVQIDLNKPARTLGSKDGPGEPDSAGGPLRNAEDELEDEDWKVYRSGVDTLLCHALDRPDIQFSTGGCMSGYSRLKVVLGIAHAHCQVPLPSLAPHLLPPPLLRENIFLFALFSFFLEFIHDPTPSHHVFARLPGLCEQ